MDVDAAFAEYLKRFDARFSDRAEGTFVKFGHTLIQKLNRDEFEERLQNYVTMRQRCREMLESGATISDAVTLDYEEAAAWIALEAPNLLELFSSDVDDLGSAL
ncbi:MAG: hypothetical protein ACPGUV_02785 [Polyangiales bacterium]